MSFEANAGQTDPRVKFLSRGHGYTLFLTSEEAVFSLRNGQSSVVSRQSQGTKHSRPRATNALNPKSQIQNPKSDAPEVLRLRLVGANPAPRIAGQEELPGKTNYLIGNDPAKWRTNIPTYAQVRYEGVYPGIDLVYYGQEAGGTSQESEGRTEKSGDRRQKPEVRSQESEANTQAPPAGRMELEFDFVVAPGADPRAIRFALETGNSKLETGQSAIANQQSAIQVDANGDLVVSLGEGEVRFRKPVVYQERSRVESSELRVTNRQSAIDNRQFLDGRYVLLAKNEVGFQLAAYDARKPLIIDPSYYNAAYVGSSGTDVGTGIAWSSGNYVYLAGWTDSTAFPVTGAPYQSTSGGGKDAFVWKYSPGSLSVVYTTYFGGSGDDLVNGIAVDGSGNAYITGATNSGNLPVKGSPAAIQAWNNGGDDAFVTVLNSTGSGLIYSTYLGGSADDSAQGIALGTAGAAYVVGTTQSNNFPHTTGAYQATFGGGTCGTAPNTFTCHDAFVTVVNSAGNALTYSTYLGGSGDDLGKGMALDVASNAYVTGSTGSSNFPVTLGVVQPTCGTDTLCDGGLSDAFVSKLNPAASGAASLVYSTYLGGSGVDAGNGIAVDSSNNAYVTGGTTSTDFPVTAGAFKTANAGSQDAFVTKVDATASSRVYSTYLGGSADEQANAIALSAGNAYVIGQTASLDFPVQNAMQSTYGGNGDAFVTKLGVLGNVLIFSSYFGSSQLDVGYGISPSGTYAWVVVTTASSRWFYCYVGCSSNNAGGASDALWAQITGTALPIGVLSPTTLTFPDQVVSSTSAAQTVTLRNDGDAVLTISSIVSSGDFDQTNNCPIYVSPYPTLAAGASCTITVTFTPAAVGTRPGTLTINDNNNGVSSTQTVPLSGRGTSAGVLALNPSPLTFTGTPVWTTSSPLPVTVSNTGVGPLVISGFSTTGPFGQTNNCSVSPSPLFPATSCTANVTFSPTLVGASAGSLVVTHDAAGSPGSVVLIGNGLGPLVTLLPTRLVFANQNVGTTSSPQAVALTNSGTLPLGISNMAVTANYAQTNNCGTSLAAAASCTINVTFTPGTTAVIPGMLYLSDSAAGSPHTVELLGTGVGPAASLAPPNLGFNDQVMNVPSPMKTVTLTNTGTASLSVSAVTIIGPNSTDFTETDNCVGANLPVGAGCTVRAVFSPKLAGSRMAIVAISDAAADSPQMGTVTGTGRANSQAFPPQAYVLTRADYGTGAYPISVVLDDFNGDGRLDLALADRDGAAVSILLGAANGTFQPHVESATGQKPSSVASGDFNRDGKRDLAVTNFQDNTVSILLGNGNGTFQTQTVNATGGGPSGVATGDFNGDGKPDLAVTNFTDNTVSILLGNGDGSFQPQQTFASTGTNPSAVAVGNFNAGSVPDLAVTNQGSNNVSIFLGNGDGSFTPASTPSVGNAPSSVVVGDFNKDNKRDLAVSNFSGDTISVLLGNGDGTLPTLKTLTTGLNPTGVIVGDFNKDTKPDLAVADSNCNLAGVCESPGFVSVFLGNGDGNFQNRVQYATGTGPQALATGDINGDSFADLAAANSSDNTVSILLGQGNGTFSTRTDQTAGGTNPSAVVIGDFNGDGIPDLAVANYDANTVSVSLGNVDGTFQTPQTFATGTSPTALAVGDFNADSKLDLAVTNYTSNTASLLLGKGDGTFQPQTTSATGANPQGVAAADFNKDNKLDLAVANFTDNTVSILLGKADGTFQPQTTVGTGANPYSLATGDFNADTKPDLAVANQGSNTVSVLLGNGDGTFNPAVNYPTGSGPSWVAASDLSGDGKLDLVIANFDDNTVSVLLGRGDGTFQSKVNYGTGAGPVSVTVGDFNGDAILDFAVANKGSAGGLGGLGLRAFSLPGHYKSLDEPTCPSGSGIISVLLGAGSGTFNSAVNFATTSCPTSIAKGDFGGNSSGGIAVSNSGGMISIFLSTPVVALSQTSVAFGNQPVGSTVGPVTVTLSNPGSVRLTLSSISVTGQFTQSNNCPAPGFLAVGAQCSININYAPTTIGPATGQVTITDNGRGSPHIITLSGSGSTSALSLSPTNVNFGTQLVGTTSAPQTVTVTSSGVGTLTISSVTLTGPNAGDFLKASDTCSGASLPPSSTCTISVTFTPPALGTKAATLTIPSNAPGSPHTVTLSGIGSGPPAVTLSPTNLSFGNQALATTSAPKPVALTNSGQGPLTINSITTSGNFAQTNNCASPLAAAASCTINVTFTPTVVGGQGGTLTMVDNAAGSPHTVGLGGVGLGPLASVSPTSLSFANQAVGTTSAPKLVNLSNSGNTPLTITSITISGNFAQTNNCVSPLAAHTYCTINVTFSPTAGGTRTGAITITDNAAGSPRTVSLTGNGTVPAVTLSPTGLSFGNQALGTTSTAKPVKLTNSGLAPLTITSIGTSGNYAQTNNCVSPLAAKAYCTIQVTFTPTVVGGQSGTLTIVDNAPASPHTVGLGGVGLGPLASISPTSLSFANQAVGTTSAPKLVNLSNSGNAPLTITSITASGDLAQTSNCVSPLPARTYCTISVTFKPTAAGTRTGSLTITDNAAGSPHTVALSGVGTTAPAATLQPTSLRFADQPLGSTSAPKSVTLTNTGGAPLTISSITTSGNYAQTNNCVSPLAAGAYCTINVTFTPQVAGGQSGTLTIMDNAVGSPHTVGLGGVGLGPLTSISPTSLPFGSLGVGATSAPKLVYLGNSGNAPLTITSITISGDFAQTNNCVSPLAAHTYCTINVTFSPTAGGTRTGAITITDNAAGSPHTVSLSGTGTTP